MAKSDVRRPDDAADILSVGLFDAAEIRRALDADRSTPTRRGLLSAGQETLKQAFHDGVPARQLVAERSRLVDEVLIHAWQDLLGDACSDAALVAVGGYGRAELLPHSDIDLLILHADGALDALGERLERFITLLWDLGLKVGHSVRTPADCSEQARGDVTVMTNMLESRLLNGDRDLFQAMQSGLEDRALWSTADFMKAKLEEQTARHAKYGDTAYKLEPNVKEGPGGLRDLHILRWIARHVHGAATFERLSSHGLITEQERDDLRAREAFLLQVRFALHLLTDAGEDRLLFDHQAALAKLFGYDDRSHNLAIEQFMQHYFQNIKAITALSDIVLQLLRETILESGTPASRPVGRRFAIIDGSIDVVSDTVFRRAPHALLELFLVMQKDETITGIRARTLRLIRRDRHYITEETRNDIRARSLFIEMFRQPAGLTRSLRRMNRYGILGRYIPAFGDVIGLMQYDLFHTLTVDEHTLFVLRNARRMAIPRFRDELPFCHELAAALPKPELLYLGAFFHDIAKGRGGDHSELGARDAKTFCLEHGLSTWDSDLVAWLVRNHLLMSVTAQRRDISDPRIIREFAQRVGDKTHLDYLFLLTVADIRGTNPELWNSWKESLLTQLYNATRRNLEQGTDKLLEEAELVSEKQRDAAALLPGRIETDVVSTWSRFDHDYFLRHSAEEIAWHGEAIIEHANEDGPLVLVRQFESLGTSVFVYTRDADYLFGLITGVLAQLGLTILEARIQTTEDGYTLDTYIVISGNGESISDPDRLHEIRTALMRVLESPGTESVAVSQKIPRQLRHFSTPTQVFFSPDPENNRTIMELVAADRPGLLSLVGRIFRRRGIVLKAAKIGTIGERVEDVFFITERNHQPIEDPAVFHDLRRLLVRTLDRPNH